jgi:mannose-6-phosphate isomerase
MTLQERLRRIWQTRHAWLFDAVLPFWATAGVDLAGGFHDQLDAAGVALSLPKRMRVQARQLVVYAWAGQMGWPGPWRDVVQHGLKFMRAHALPDGLLPSRYENGGATGLAIYDQAFVLLALAQAHAAVNDAALEHDALALLQTLQNSFGRRDGGFNENGAGAVPLQANTNMHLFEACLAWRQHGASDLWGEAAARIGHLAVHTFVDPATGRLREFFDDEGRPDPHQHNDVEPGHQFEWGSLFFSEGRNNAIAERLIRDASDVGVDRKRNVALNSLNIDGSVRDSAARLWVQTERLRAVCLMVQRVQDGDHWRQEAIETETAMDRYFQTSIAGLWRDVMREDGTFDDGATQASSLYHIFGAYLALKELTER